MAVKHIDGNLYRTISLDWKFAIRWTNNSKIVLGEEAYCSYGMYRFERSHPLKNGPRELIYIGLAFRQYIGKRIEQHQVERVTGMEKTRRAMD